MKCDITSVTYHACNTGIEFLLTGTALFLIFVLLVLLYSQDVGLL